MHDIAMFGASSTNLQSHKPQQAFVSGMAAVNPFLPIPVARWNLQVCKDLSCQSDHKNCLTGKARQGVVEDRKQGAKTLGLGRL